MFVRTVAELVPTPPKYHPGMERLLRPIHHLRPMEVLQHLQLHDTMAE